MRVLSVVVALPTTVTLGWFGEPAQPYDAGAWAQPPYAGIRVQPPYAGSPVQPGNIQPGDPGAS
jgi:hypothetical protein